MYYIIFSFPLFIIAEVPRVAFSSLASIISNVHSLKLARDKHNRDIVLASFIQFVFISPTPPSNPLAFDPAYVTAQRSGSFSLDDDPMNKRSASMRHSRHIVVQRKLLLYKYCINKSDYPSKF